MLGLLGRLAEERTGGRAPGAYRSQLVVAEDYIDRHLPEPGLGAAQVAGVMGIVVRHLGRILSGRTGNSSGPGAGEDRRRRAPVTCDDLRLPAGSLP